MRVGYAPEADDAIARFAEWVRPKLGLAVAEREYKMNNRPLAVARACLQAYVDKDRAAIEVLLDDDFHFTSPIDNALDRATYLKVCWPNSKLMASFDYIYGCEDGDRAFIVYEACTLTGKRFRNSEVYTVRGGKLVATEVYFGWDLPHKVSQGAHIENEAQQP